MTVKQQLAAAVARTATLELENKQLRAALIDAILREQTCEDALNRPIINTPPASSGADTSRASSSGPASSGDVR